MVRHDASMPPESAPGWREDIRPLGQGEREFALRAGSQTLLRIAFVVMGTASTVSVVLMVVGLLQPDPFRDDGPFFAGAVIAMFAWGLVVWAAITIWRRRIEVGPSGLLVVNSGSSYAIPWEAVDDISLEAVAGEDGRPYVTRMVVVTAHDGRFRCDVPAARLWPTKSRREHESLRDSARLILRARATYLLENTRRAPDGHATVTYGGYKGIPLTIRRTLEVALGIGVISYLIVSYYFDY